MKTTSKFFLIIVLFIANVLQATTYYVDATEGNDNNNGTSPELAWRSLEKVNVQTFVAGDSILFKRGGIFRGNLNPQNSGNADNWIVYSAYGTGANPQLLGSEPIINWELYSGNVYKKPYVNLPYYAGKGVYEFDNYNEDPTTLIEDEEIPSLAGHYYYDENLNNGTLYIYCSDEAAPSTHNIEVCWHEEIISVDYNSYLEFSNLSLKFGNCKNIMLYGCTHINISNVNSSFQGHYGNPNIFSMGGDYVKIEDCVLYDSWNSAIAFYPIGTTLPGNYNTVRGCSIIKVHFNDGITIHQDGSGNYPGDYYLLENNIIGECQEGSIDAFSDYHVFRNNICFNNEEDAFQIDCPGDHILIENNLCFGMARNGILSFGISEPGSTGGTIVRNNIVYDNVKYCFMGGPQRTAIYNNTILNSETRSEMYFYEEPSEGSTYKNNIIYNELYTSEVRFGTTALPNTIEMDYNNYSVISPDSLIFGIAVTNEHHTLAEMQGIYDKELNSFILDPGFIDLANKDFHLAPDSPCIDAGDFLTRTTGGGSGTQIPVENSIYFFDGNGIVEADSIQLEGQSQKLKIVNIDDENGIITVNQNVSWDPGTGVSLAYNGTAPDIGAYEYSIQVGISERITNNSVSVFPNPAKNKIQFSKDFTNYNYEIISLSGIKQKNGIIDCNSIMLNELNSGIYFIRIYKKGSDKMRITKLIKE
jgi:hypothetical protein